MRCIIKTHPDYIAIQKAFPDVHPHLLDGAITGIMNKNDEIDLPSIEEVSEYLGIDTLLKDFTKPKVEELFDSNPELANQVYEALGFKTKPDVILPIGTSGSGKSTFIKSLPQENLVVIEPDAMRVEFTGDINNKSKDKEIYEEAAKRAISAIKQGKQVVFDTTNLTKDKRLPFIEAIKKEIPNANIQYKLMELNPELAKQRIKAQIVRGENRANVPDSTIDRHAESYKQMLEDIQTEPISNYEITPQQKQQAIQLYSQYLDTGKQNIEEFKEYINNSKNTDTIYSLSTYDSNDKDYAADALVTDFLNSLGIDVQSIGEIRDHNGNVLDAVAKADLLNGIIQFVEGKRDITTLPEEAAHIMVRLLKNRNNPLYNIMAKQIKSTPLYKQVLEEYADVYSTEEQFVEEAIGKLVAQHIVGLTNGGKGNNLEKTNNWFIRFINAIKALIKPYVPSYKDKFNAFENVAKAITTNNISLVGLDTVSKKDLIDRINKNENTLYQISSNPIDKLNSLNIVKTNSDQFSLDPSNKLYIDNAGNIFPNRISFLKDVNKIFNEPDYKISKKELEYRAGKGTFVHKLSENIFKNLVKNNVKPGDIVDVPGILSSTINELASTEEFKNNKGLLTIDNDSLKNVYKGVYNLYKSIKEEDPNAEILTEVTVGNVSEGLIGTIDVLVIHGDGSASIYDYKTRKYDPVFNALGEFTGYKDVYDSVRDDYDTQIAAQVEILKNLGIKTFRKTRIVPINHQFKWDKKNDRLDNGKYSGSKFNMYNSLDATTTALNVIPVAGEMSDFQGLNNILTKLYDIKAKLSSKINKSDKTNINDEIQLTRISKAIDALLLDTGIDELLYEISDKLHLANKLNTLKAMTVDELIELQKYLEIYSTFSADYAEKLSELAKTDKVKADEYKSKLASYNTSIGVGLHNISKVIIEKVDSDNTLATFNLTYTDPGTGSIEITPTAEKAGMFTSFSNSSNRIFNAAGLLTSIAKEHKNELFIKFYEELNSKFEVLKSKGIKDFEWMLEQNTVVGMLNKEFFVDKADAVKNKKAKWFKDNYEFDSKRFDEYYKAIADSNNLTSEEKAKKLSFIETLDVRVTSEAWYKKNNFIKPKKVQPNSKYANTKWSAIQNDKDKLAYFDAYKEMLREFNKLTNGNFDIRDNIIPKVRQSTVESLGKLISSGVSPKGLLSSLQITEHDSLIGNVDENGNPIDSIPLLYVSELEEPLTDSEIAAAEKKAFDKYKEHFGKKYKNLGTDDAIKKSKVFNVLFEKYKKIERINKGKKITSRDLHKSMVMLMDQVSNYVAMSGIESQVKTLQLLLVNQKNLVTNSQNKQVFNPLTRIQSAIAGDKNNLERFNTLIRSVMYGQKMQGKDLTFSLGDSTISGKKAIDRFDKVMTIQALALDPILASSNFIGGKLNSYYLGKEGLYYTSKQLRAREFRTADDKVILDHFRYSTKGDIEKFKRKASLNSGIDKGTSMDSLMVLHGIGDDKVDQSIFLAMLDNWIPMPDGMVRSKTSLFNEDIVKGRETFRDLIEVKDGKIVFKNTKKGEPISRENIAAFKMVYHNAVNKVKGTITDENLMGINTTILGKVLFKFRSWMPGVLSTRYGSTKYDFATGEIDMGRFMPFLGELSSTVFNDPATMFKEITALTAEVATFGVFNIKSANKEVAQKYYKKFLADNPNLPIKPTFEQFVKLRERKLKSMIQELRMYALFATAVFGLLSSLDWDDEDEGVIANLIYNTSKRAYLELAFFFSPEANSEILKEPIPHMRTIGNWVKVITEPSKLFTNTVNIIPVMNKFNKVLMYPTKELDKATVGEMVDGLEDDMEAMFND